MVSELGSTIWHAVIRHYESGESGVPNNGGPELIDALLAPVRKFISLVNSKPCECESMKQHALEILASLDPKPEDDDDK